ncbi:DksA/TraR family C4-type zinc finger protein [Altericroceibacterium spongiae]|uniref:DksA/TraR family C4-type zinc finger protein n=1 Tax=Altericroceibacterium spongiae TaxID=2320269 RepID=A0A420EPD1_9SPHN|nr:DksA/TraR family C4-type zinc finger protein [Altericroceibacterium spongiae]RKF22533.1 DksA/TraR family C4-type zinc finger protein [Altericroceibacterium spongiae]
MAGGWSRDGAVQEQIDDTISDAVQRARANLSNREGSLYCEECGEEIPEARRKALPGARTCVACQQERDRTSRASSAFNRRGSKDSQLR